jgi:hypothetical protein
MAISKALQSETIRILNEIQVFRAYCTYFLHPFSSPMDWSHSVLWLVSAHFWKGNMSKFRESISTFTANLLNQTYNTVGIEITKQLKLGKFVTV